MQRLTSRGIEYGDVALIRRGVADIAAGDGNDVAPGIVERRRDLLPGRQVGNRSIPELVAVGDGELFDMPIRRGAVDRGAIGVRHRRDIRYARRSGPRAI